MTKINIFYKCGSESWWGFNEDAEIHKCLSLPQETLDRSRQNMEQNRKIDAAIDQRSRDTLRDLWMDIKIHENGKVVIERGIVSHFSTLKINWKIVPNWNGITMDSWDKLTMESFNTIPGKDGSTEVAVFVAKNREGKILGKIQAESYISNDWTSPKNINF